LSETEGGKDHRAHVYVSGIVQGVAFRYYAQQKAEELDVSGWVKNLLDGRVEAVFEGDPDRVREIVAWCESGPSSADVEDVTVKDETPEGLTSFEVR
jgi:acylphosphatase